MYIQMTWFTSDIGKICLGKSLKMYIYEQVNIPFIELIQAVFGYL